MRDYCMHHHSACYCRDGTLHYSDKKHKGVASIAATTITLTEQKQMSLQALAQQTGKTPEALPHEAVVQFLRQSQVLSRRYLLQQAHGMWRDRDDVPALAALRREFERWKQAP